MHDRYHTGSIQIAGQALNPANAGHVGAATHSANHIGLMAATRSRDGNKTRQTVRENGTLERKMLPGPGADCLRAKAFDQIKSHAHSKHHDYRDEGNVISGPRPS